MFDLVSTFVDLLKTDNTETNSFLIQVIILIKVFNGITSLMTCIKQ